MAAEYSTFIFVTMNILLITGPIGIFHLAVTSEIHFITIGVVGKKLSALLYRALSQACFKSSQNGKAEHKHY